MLMAVGALAGGVMSAAGAAQAGNAQAQQYEAQAQEHRANAELKRRQSVLELTTEQQKQRRRDIESMQRRFDELDDEEKREVAAITDRYADVKPHTTAAAVVFALTPEDAREGLQ